VWVIWILWIVATLAGEILYFIPVAIVHFALGLWVLTPEQIRELATPMLVLAAVLVGAACGLSIGVAQWVVLRRELKQVREWIAATMAGYAAIGLLVLIGNLVQPGWLNFASMLIIEGKLLWIARVQPEWAGSAWLPGAITLVLFGAVLGSVQWLVLRDRIRGAYAWIAINAIGWGLVAALSTAVVSWADFITATNLPPLITGVGIAWLTRYPARSNPLHNQSA
jgi:hypothetical protein